MKEVLTPDHHSVKSAPEVQDICYNFFQYSKINSFVHARIFDQGYTYGVNSNAKWQLHHFNNGHLVTPPIPKNLVSTRFNFILSLKTAPPSFLRTMQDFRNLLGMDYPYLIIERYSTFYDIYVFCADVGNEAIINFYLNEQTYIEKFKQYFKSKAKLLLKESQKNRIFIPEFMRPEVNWNCHRQEAPNFGSFRYSISLGTRDVEFTQREVECLKYLTRGYSTKYLASVLHISPRTVEFHVENIKNKMQMHTLSEALVFLDKKKLFIDL